MSASDPLLEGRATDDDRHGNHGGLGTVSGVVAYNIVPSPEGGCTFTERRTGEQDLTTGKQDLTRMCAIWQERLRLQDWRVSVDYGKAFALGQAERSAEVTWDVAERYARISLLRAADFSENEVAPYDVEEALVHELLHLHFASFRVPIDKPKGQAQELAINMIAGALVKLAHGGEAGGNEHEAVG